jgi:GxxExxY protein
MENIKIDYYAKQLVDAGYRVHKESGPGLLESVYLFCIMDELRLRGIHVEQEVLLPLYYRGNKLEKDFRIDILV